MLPVFSSLLLSQFSSEIGPRVYYLGNQTWFSSSCICDNGSPLKQSTTKLHSNCSRTSQMWVFELLQWSPVVFHRVSYHLYKNGLNVLIDS